MPNIFPARAPEPTGISMRRTSPEIPSAQARANASDENNVGVVPLHCLAASASEHVNMRGHRTVCVLLYRRAGARCRHNPHSLRIERPVEDRQEVTKKAA